MGFGRWDGDTTSRSYFYTSVSTNGGFSFSDSLRMFQLGEDKSFIWNSDTHEYWGYVRPRNILPDCCNGCIAYGNGVRKIALMKNSAYFPNSGNWSARDTIVEIDQNYYNDPNSPDYRTQTYYMQVFRIGADWWGLVGMYRVGNNGGQTNDFPYSSPEYTSDVELMWSADGEDWHRTNNSQPFIALHDSIKTIYSVGTVVGDSVYFYSSESTILHATYKVGGCLGTPQDSAFNGKFYSIYLYKMSINKLNEWGPPSVVVDTSTVEGFLNTGSGKHNLRDTLTGELRNTTTPYALVSTVKAVIDSVTFAGIFNFPHVTPGSYFLVLRGRNSLETWSASGITITNNTSSNYNFTSSGGKAYGSNLILVGGRYCIYSGDVDNDGSVTLTDFGLIDNDALNFVTGYVDTDLTGDYAVDIADVTIADNNLSNYIGVISP